LSAVQSRRLVIGYLVLLAVLAAAAALSFGAGRDGDAQPSVAGRYGGCLGTLTQSGSFVDAADGKLRLGDGRLTGETAACGRVDVAVDELLKRRIATPEAAVAAPIKRSNEEKFGRLMLAIAVVILAARAFGALLGRLGQPRVMGEVLAGVLLGGPSWAGSASRA
jgi:hypothetical protein